MKRIEYFELLIGLFSFKSIFDEENNEYVVFGQSHLDRVNRVRDKTQFEAVENHIHLIDRVRKEEFERLGFIAQDLGGTVLLKLKSQYPGKKFVVFVSIKMHDSMILRFHQIWDGEPLYYNPADFSLPDEKVFAYEG